MERRVKTPAELELERRFRGGGPIGSIQNTPGYAGGGGSFINAEFCARREALGPRDFDFGAERLQRLEADFWRLLCDERAAPSWAVGCTLRSDVNGGKCVLFYDDTLGRDVRMLAIEFDTVAVESVRDSAGGVVSELLRQVRAGLRQDEERRCAEFRARARRWFERLAWDRWGAWAP